MAAEEKFSWMCVWDTDVFTSWLYISRDLVPGVLFSPFLLTQTHLRNFFLVGGRGGEGEGERKKEKPKQEEGGKESEKVSKWPGRDPAHRCRLSLHSTPLLFPLPSHCPSTRFLPSTDLVNPLPHRCFR